MANEIRTITIDPESELGQALADDADVVLQRGGVRYRVSRTEDDLFADYDPERVRDGLRRFAGTITAEEAERLKAIVYQGREDGTRPLDRP
jgi:hypothetical protein